MDLNRLTGGSTLSKFQQWAAIPLRLIVGYGFIPRETQLRELLFVATFHKIAPSHTSGMDYISALWEYEEKQPLIRNPKDAPRNSRAKALFPDGLSESHFYVITVLVGSHLTLRLDIFYA